MAFLTDIPASRYFRARHPVAGGGFARASLSRFAISAIKEAWRVVSALAIIATIMALLALLDMWIWVPHLFR